MARPPFQIGEFVGQKTILKPVLRRQDGAKARGEPMPHHLFTGASGLGKSLFAQTLAGRAGTRIFKFSSQETPEEITEQFRQMQPCDVAFFDECHRCDDKTQELFYDVIDKHIIPAKLVANPTNAEPVKVAPVTFIFATDRPGQLNNALVKRIPATVRFQPYPEDEMREIVSRIAARRNVLLSPQAAGQLAKVCHGIPRRAEHRVNDVRLYFPDSERRQLGRPDVLEYLADDGVDADGLGRDERAYLEFLARNGTASLEALAGYLGTDREFVRQQIEQRLRYCGLIIVRSTGRLLTADGEERVQSFTNTSRRSEGE
jgi:Holliday junction DNA helicase RuvB